MRKTPGGASAKTTEARKAIIQAVIRHYGPISRASIHELTHIRRSATSDLVKELLQEGRIVEAGRVSRTTGRKQVLVRLNEQFRSVAAVDFDDERVRAGVTDLRPSVRHTITERTDVQSGVEGLLRQLIACTRRAIQEASLGNAALIGVGVADPGLVDSRQGVTIDSSTIEFWKQVPVREVFEKEFGLPTVVETRTRAVAAAERLLGAGELADSMIYIDYGVGIGSGIVVDGKLLYGRNCAAGEFGHTHTMPDGPACKCGSFGCLEAVAGGRAVEHRFRRAIAEGGWSEAVALAGGDPEQVSVWMVLEAAGRGDKICCNILAEVSAHLGLGLSNLVNLFNPSVVVLDERLRLAGDRILADITGVIQRQALRYSSENASVRFGSVGQDGAILGAALMVVEQHFEAAALAAEALCAD